MANLNLSDLKDALKLKNKQQKKDNEVLNNENNSKSKEVINQPSNEFIEGLNKYEIPDVEEEINFSDVMSNVKIIKQDKINKQKAPIDPKITESNKARLNEEQTNTYAMFLSTEYLKFVEPNEIIQHKVPGVQAGVFKKLKAGEYEPQAYTDLHGHTVNGAFTKVKKLIQRATEKNLRCVLIIHGKGEFSTPKALLKSYVVHWLKHMPEVIAFHTAMPYHGDKGATYVLLKKSEISREETREIIAKRRKKH
jgi:DNA-nicking Smr family endonuclease